MSGRRAIRYQVRKGARWPCVAPAVHAAPPIASTAFEPAWNAYAYGGTTVTVDRQAPAVAPAVDDRAIVFAMPALGRELVGALGLMPTLALLRKFGGMRAFVPAKLSDDPSELVSSLLAALGRPTVKALIERFGGNLLELPLMASVERVLRDNALRAEFDAGAGVRTLVARYGLTNRTIRKLLKAQPVDRRGPEFCKGNSMTTETTTSAARRPACCPQAGPNKGERPAFPSRQVRRQAC